MTRFLSQLSVLCLLTMCCAYSGETLPKTYAAGAGEVKSWTSRSYESIKDSFQPMLIYFYDSKPKRNLAAYHFEKAETLGNAAVKEKLAKFAKSKIKIDDEKSKVWPEEMRKPAESGAALLLLSSDLKMRFPFDKSDYNPQAIAAAAGKIQAYEDQLKIAADKAEKLKHPEVAEKAKEPDMFTIGLEKDKKKQDAKVDPKKPGDKTADAKVGEKAPADPKKDPKKMVPQDE